MVPVRRPCASGVRPGAACVDAGAQQRVEDELCDEAGTRRALGPLQRLARATAPSSPGLVSPCRSEQHRRVAEFFEEPAQLRVSEKSDSNRKARRMAGFLLD